MKKLLCLLLVTGTLYGCGNDNKEPPLDRSGHGLIRAALNKQCLAQAANINKATHQNYNDLDEVVSTCSDQSYYQANDICDKGCSLSAATYVIKTLRE